MSGAGSSLHSTEAIRQAIPDLLCELGVQSLLDAPCGDWNWMREVDLGSIRYVGVDVVEPLINANISKFSAKTRSFHTLDLIRDLMPRCDLILCRDLLVHLSFRDCFRVLENFNASGAQWLLTTRFVDQKVNKELTKGKIWRPLNLELPPFNLSEPNRYLDEKCVEASGKFRDKHLGLWRLPLEIR